MVSDMVNDILYVTSRLLTEKGNVNTQQYALTI